MHAARDDMGILFVTFFSKRADLYEKRKEDHEGSMIPPLGILSIAGYLKQSGYARIRLHDFGVDTTSKSAFIEMLAGFRPALVGLSVYAESHVDAVKLAALIKEVLPETKVVFGGAQATFTARELLEGSAGDFVCMGEGEVTTFELLERLRSGGRNDFGDIAGLAWKDGDGAVRVNGPRRPVARLDALPFPDRSLIAGKQYVETFTIASGRGCSGNCAFCCSRAFWKTGVRFRSPENTFSEVLDLFIKGEHERGFNTSGWFFIIDDAFTISRRRVIAFCAHLRAAGLSLAWGCHSRLDDLDAELLEIMRIAGCRHIEIGIESCDQRTLDSIGKGIDLSRLDEVLGGARAAGVSITCSFIIGFPRDTKEDMRRNLAFAIDLWEKYDLASATLAYNTPYPGTAFYNKANELGLRIRADGWSRFMMDNPIVESDSFSIDDLAGVFAEYQTYLRQRYARRGRYIRRPAAACDRAAN